MKKLRASEKTGYIYHTSVAHKIVESKHLQLQLWTWGFVHAWRVCTINSALSL